MKNNNEFITEIYARYEEKKRERKRRKKAAMAFSLALFIGTTALVGSRWLHLNPSTESLPMTENNGSKPPYANLDFGSGATAGGVGGLDGAENITSQEEGSSLNGNPNENRDTTTTSECTLAIPLPEETSECTLAIPLPEETSAIHIEAQDKKFVLEAEEDIRLIYDYINKNRKFMQSEILPDIGVKFAYIIGFHGINGEWHYFYTMDKHLDLDHILNDITNK